MRRFPICVVLMILLGLALPVRLLWAQAAPRTDTVLLLHTNDLHDNLRPLGGRWGGLVYVSGYAHHLREQRPDVLMVDAGDICEKGDMLGVVSEGRLTHRAVAQVGYDAVTPGNHENAYGVARWIANVKEAGLPLVACNVLYEDDQSTVFPPYREVVVDGVKVGIIGLGNALRGTAGGRKTTTLTATAAAPRVAALAHELKTRNDLVVVTAHWGSADCRKIAAVAPEVDVFVSGHTHELLPEPLQVGPSGALIVQTGAYAQRVGELELTVDLDTNKVIAYHGRLVRMDHATTPVDQVLSAQLIRWNQRWCPEALKIIARAPLTLAQSRPSGRPAPLTVWMAEALRAYTGADLAVYNNSMSRHDLRVGPVSADDLYKTALNRERRVVCQVTCTGAQLLGAVEKLLARSDARGLYLSGLPIKTDLSRPAGQRVVSSNIVGSKQYRLAVPSLLCSDSKGKSTLGMAIQQLPYTMYEVAIAEAQKTGTVRLKRP